MHNIISLFRLSISGLKCNSDMFSFHSLISWVLSTRSENLNPSVYLLPAVIRWTHHTSKATLMCDRSSPGQCTLGSLCVQTAGLHRSIPVANKGIRVKFNHIRNYSHWHVIIAPFELCVNVAHTDWLHLIPAFLIVVSLLLVIQSGFCRISL